MKKLITILIMCFCCSVFGAKAQQKVKVEAFSTCSKLTELRFEFIYKNTYGEILFDKYTGRTWFSLTPPVSSRKSKKFKEIVREQVDTVSASQVNYQLIVGDNIYLLNIHSGELWESVLGEFKMVDFEGSLPFIYGN